MGGGQPAHEAGQTGYESASHGASLLHTLPQESAGATRPAVLHTSNGVTRPAVQHTYEDLGNGSNVIPRRARPGLAGLGPLNTLPPPLAHARVPAQTFSVRSGQPPRASLATSSNHPVPLARVGAPRAMGSEDPHEKWDLQFPMPRVESPRLGPVPRLDLSHFQYESGLSHFQYESRTRASRSAASPHETRPESPSSSSLLLSSLELSDTKVYEPESPPETPPESPPGALRARGASPGGHDWGDV